MSARRTATRVATAAAAAGIVVGVALGIDGARWDGMSPATHGGTGVVAGARWDIPAPDGARWD